MFGRFGRFEWLPAGLAAVAFVGCMTAFVYELISYQDVAMTWAKGDLNSRAHLAASNLAEPLRTQDFRVIREFGDACEADGYHLLVTSGRGGVVFSTSDRRSVAYSAPCPCGDYEVLVGMPQERMLAPFKRALRGFGLAGLVGMAGVFLFFFVTYRQRVRIRELAKLEKFRREFIADVSHEIKTPLTGILGAVDLLLAGSGKDSASPFERRILPLLEKEAKRLNGLVQSILDLARLEREGDVLNQEETDVGELVRDVVDGLEPAASAAGIDLFLAPSLRPLCGESVKVDPQLLSQAVSNLIVNAIRHSGSKDVTVSIRFADRAVSIAVEDHGVGIPPEHAAQIFERFHRVDPARSAETGGAGLGLAIVRRIARLHGGDVMYAAAKPRGSVFTLQLPVR